jgi:hypothetical protein
MTYGQITKKIHASKQRVAKLSKRIEIEREKQNGLLVELGAVSSTVTGDIVQIGVRKNSNPNYSRDKIVNRIVELRDNENKSFAVIADVLNAEGFVPKIAKTFSQATVHQLYTGAVKSTELAAASAT